MPFVKDDIDAVSITQLVNGDTAFQIYLTRGGLTQRLGSSDKADPAAILIKGRTDLFEPFMAAVPESLLQRESAAIEDGGRDGERHDWRFEFQGGLNTLVYDVSYHASSASLPDEFADMVVLAERLTHSWWVAAVAEETGAPIATPAKAVAPPAPKAAAPARRGAPSQKGASAPAGRPSAGRAAPAAAAPRGRGGLVPATRERIGLAVLLDFFFLGIPYALIGHLVVGGGDPAGPPGAGLVLFAIAEFVLLQIVRRSPGTMLLGISIPAGAKPQIDPARSTRESKATLAAGIGLVALGVSGLTAWTLYNVSVPWFGATLPVFVSAAISVVGSLGLVAGGGLLLTGDVRGVWLGGGLCLALLVTALMGWSVWGTFVDAAVFLRSEYAGRMVGQGFWGPVLDALPIAFVAVPAALLAGLYESWRRLSRSGVPMPQTAR